MSAMKKITTFYCNNRTFHIVKDDRGFWGIEDCFVDEDGRINTTLNGISGHLHGTMADTIESIRFQTRLDKLIASGMSFDEAARVMWAD